MKSGRSLLVLLSTLLVCVGALSACEGCRAPSTPAARDGAAAEAPSARLYLVSDLAGALEPCGCVKDQLGGMDRFGALVTADKASAPAYATLSAGPLFFMDMDLADDKASQEVAKAETIASAMRLLRLEAFAPARNEWAAGPAGLEKITRGGAALVAANLDGERGASKWKIVDVGGVRVGVIGVAAPDKAQAVKTPLPDVTSSPAIPAVKAAVLEVKEAGAQAIVALAAVGRGEAKRIADENPELLAILVGATGANGDANTKPAPPEQIGGVLIVETANHLQTVGVLDLYVRDAPKTGLVTFADATGVERMRRRAELGGRIDELRAKIATWEKDKSIHARDLAARRADVERLERERDALDAAPSPASGSFYRYSMREIRETLGTDDAVQAQMLAYYKKVNDDNKVAFKDKVPVAAPPGQAGYVGVATCAACHADAKTFWDGTSHARAYATLERQFKEANLDCVGCHVTGYDKPGGSTVTHVEGLKDVQCEVCHGPGSLHAASGGKVQIALPRPGANTCIACHHPPHVHSFDAAAKMNEILGPGHGRPPTK